jgi:hypothetical protein
MKLLFVILTVVITATRIDTTEHLKNYSVRKINGDLSVSGKGDDPRWRQAHALTDFHYPWENETTPYTEFRAVHSDDWVYFLFHIKDDHVNIRQENDDKREVAASSRAEIFFRMDDKLKPYYCLEIDPLARVLDYEATYYRNFDFNWSWPANELVIRSSRLTDGYMVEFAISKKSLQELGLLKNDMLQAGLFRANCSHKANGEEEFKWISWMNPDSKTPDFHIPSSFGVLSLID